MKLDLEKQMMKLEKEKSFKKEREEERKQLDLEDAPIKIKVEKREEHKSFIEKIKDNFSQENQEDTDENSEKITPNYDKWVLPELNLLRDI
jgi:hypothetical protein